MIRKQQFVVAQIKLKLKGEFAQLRQVFSRQNSQQQE